MTNKEFFQQCWRSEVTPTLVALKALPSADKLGYKPAEKNRTAKQLVDHFVSHAEDLIEGVETGVINHRVMADYPTTEDAINAFEKETEKLIAAIDAVDDKTWEEKNVPLLIFGNNYLKNPWEKCAGPSSSILFITVANCQLITGPWVQHNPIYTDQPRKWWKP